LEDGKGPGLRLPTDANVIRYLGQHLVDYLLADFAIPRFGTQPRKLDGGAGKQSQKQHHEGYKKRHSCFLSCSIGQPHPTPTGAGSAVMVAGIVGWKGIGAVTVARMS
jgi:hypothetical protein